MSSAYAWVLDLADLVADRSAEELIGAMFFAMIVAGISALLCRQFARRAADPLTLSIAIILVGNAISLVAGGLFIVHKDKASKLNPAARLSTAQQRAAMAAEHNPRPNHWPFRGDHLWATLDHDHDGRLSAGEIDAIATVLRKWDADHDGTLSPREWWHVRPDHRERQTSSGALSSPLGHRGRPHAATNEPSDG